MERQQSGVVPDDAEEVNISIVEAEVYKHNARAAVQPTIFAQFADEIPGRGVASNEILFIASAVIDLQQSTMR